MKKQRNIIGVTFIICIFKQYFVTKIKGKTKKLFKIVPYNNENDKTNKQSKKDGVYKYIL